MNQKLGVTFDSDELGIIHFSKISKLCGNRERSINGRLQDQKGRGTKAPTVPVKAVKAAAATVLCVPEAQSSASKSTNLSLAT